MSGLCGWFAPGREPAASAQLIGAMAAALGETGGNKPFDAFAQFGALAACGGAPNVFQEDSRLVAVCGRLRFADAALAEHARIHGSARALAEGHARSGEGVLASLAGSFALAILDGASGEGLLAIDRSGIHPLTWTQAGPALVFGSTSSAINRFPGLRPEIDPQAVYNYVHFHMVPGPDTIYRGQQRLLPGERLRFANGRAQVAPYWEMRFEEDLRRPFADLRQEFLDGLRGAVRDAAEGATTGAFLSGGTDSSTIAGMLGEVSGAPARTYSIGFEAEGYDEMEYARISARHFGTEHHEYYVTPQDIVDAIPKIAAVHDQPFGNSSAVPTYYCARLAKSDGIERLLGGDGGDELFGGNERYATQYIYSLYSKLPAALRRLAVEPLAHAIPGGDRITLLRRTRNYIRQASEPLPARLLIHNLLERFGPAEVFDADYLRGIDLGRPLGLLKEAWDGAHARTQINRLLALDLRFTLADSDLPKVVQSCELAQVDIAFPMLDDAVVAFSARLDPGLKLRRTRLRPFFKDALRGFLPDATLAKSKHGFGLPFGIWLQSHRPLQELVHGSLDSLRGRGIVRAGFLDELTGVRVAEHPGYYGTMVWVLMMLEQWLQHHRPGA